ncbi:F-box domain [Phytophthora cactorum]|nr:F-box domain [Phytophthora cactorum]
MEGERMPLLPRTSAVEEARLRNLGKRVKLQSKRLRQLWPHIAAFFMPRDIIGLGSTCHRLQRLLDNDRVWQSQYDRVLNQHVTRLLLPHLETRFDNDLPTKEKLRRVIHARHVHDPTNALQLRLREAEREVFRLELRQVSKWHKVRSVVWMNVPLVLALCCLSVWSYTTAYAEADYLTGIPSAQLRGAGDGTSRAAPANPVKTRLTGKALYTVGVLAAIEVAVMLAEFVAWSSSLQIAHSFLEKKEYLREMAAFLPSY